MKKLLPKSAKNPQGLPAGRRGFTLVELLVVVAIIAVLSVIGITIFTNVQRNARDAKRRADIDAISKSLETHYNDTSCGATSAAPYCPVQASWFSSGTTPSNPSPGGAAYTGSPSLAVATFNLCATLEAGGTYCRANQQ